MHPEVFKAGMVVAVVGSEEGGGKKETMDKTLLLPPPLLNSSFLLSSKDELLSASSTARTRKVKMRGGVGNNGRDTFLQAGGVDGLTNFTRDDDEGYATDFPKTTPIGGGGAAVAVDATNTTKTDEQKQQGTASSAMGDCTSSCCGCCVVPVAAAGIKGGETMGKRGDFLCFCCGFIKLTRRNLHILNCVAACIHLIFFLCLFAAADKQRYVLKFDRTHVTVGSSTNASANKPFLASSQAGTTCSFAKPNMLNFTISSSENTVLQTWVYPKNADTSISLKLCVQAFFAMSFAFQITVTLISNFPEKYEIGNFMVLPRGYADIFMNPEPDDMKLYEYLEGRSEKWNAITRWCSQMLSFNVLRFFEYSVSGSLVLMIIALVSGINDVELLMSIYLLAFCCMIFGLVAEYSMRGYTVLNQLQKYAFGSSTTANTMESTFNYILGIMENQLRVVSYVSHAVAWVCILVPWYIIYMHYQGWWDQCKTTATTSTSSTSALSTGGRITSSNNKQQRTTEPPAFVQAVIWIQMLLYASFGLVQLVQYWFPHKRRFAEVIYIMLSLTAKFLLGAILAANVLM